MTEGTSSHERQITDLVEELRTANDHVRAMEGVEKTLQAQLDLKSDQVVKLTIERDFYKTFSNDLTTRAEMLQAAATDIVERAHKTAKMQLVDVAMLQAKQEIKSGEHAERVEANNRLITGLATGMAADSNVASIR